MRSRYYRVYQEKVGQPTGGAIAFYNANYPFQMRPDGPWRNLRVFRQGAQFDLRTFREPDVLRKIEPYLGGLVPRELDATGMPHFHVQSFLGGRPLNSFTTHGDPVPDVVLRDLAALWRGTASIPRRALPPLPLGWPRSGDTHGFARTITQTAANIFSANQAGFGAMFAELGVPADPVAPAREAAARLRGGRPFGLLHTDLHRGNVLVRDASDPVDAPPNGTGAPANPVGASFLDWELGTWGDPLWELARHVSMFDYPTAQQSLAIDGWLEAFGPQRSANWEHDLQLYDTINSVTAGIAAMARTTNAIRKGILSADQADFSRGRIATRLNQLAPLWGLDRTYTPDEVAEIMARNDPKQIRGLKDRVKQPRRSVAGPRPKPALHRGY